MIYVKRIVHFVFVLKNHFYLDKQIYLQFFYICDFLPTFEIRINFNFDNFGARPKHSPLSNTEKALKHAKLNM